MFISLRGPPEEAAFAPLPVLNLRARSFVGSIREDQSACWGGTSIHSSRWGFDGGASDSILSWDESGMALLVGFAGGREGPKSSSDESLSEVGLPFGESFGEGGDRVPGGFSERGAGGGAGPIVRRRLVSSWLLEEGEAGDDGS